jgi:hypothetical protein
VEVIRPPHLALLRGPNAEFNRRRRRTTSYREGVCGADPLGAVGSASQERSLSIERGFEEAMRTTGKPWDWEQELFGGEGK